MFNVILKAVSVVQIAYALFYCRVVKISVVNTRAAQKQPARILPGGCTVWPKITGIVAYRLVAILTCLFLSRNLYTWIMIVYLDSVVLMQSQNIFNKSKLYWTNS